MPVVIEEVDPLEITCAIWFGKVSRAEALAYPASISPSRPEFAHRWINYFEPSADLSDLDPECLLELRERLRGVISTFALDSEVTIILVSDSKYNDSLLAAWEAMASADAEYRSNPVLVKHIRAASRALGLSPSDTQLLRSRIEARIGRSAW